MINLTGSFLLEFLSWRTILDIALVTAGFFIIYRTLKRLGSWKILVGIFMAIGVFVMAKFLELEAIIWVFNNLSQVAVIGFIVLFQPEIRKFFESAVSTRRRDRGIDNAGLAGLISDSVERLAKQNRGALLVFPGKDAIDQHLSGGEIVNAEISPQLILSIFDPHSPGHDGAIVIENGKITKLGVRLPISNRNSLPAEFGTRHYAAAGLAEVSDALIIVVSEERGTITTFNKEKADYNQSKQQTTQTIKTHWRSIAHLLVPWAEKRKLAIPWFELVVCAIVASSFWYAVVVGEAEILEKVVVAPIEYVAAPKNLMLIGDKTASAKLHLVGPKSDLNNLTNLNIKIDLSKSMPGKQILAINRDNINLPSRVQLVESEPSSLPLELVRITEKALPIKPQLVGRLPRHLKIKEVKVIPNQLPVKIGASANLERDAQLMTTPIFLGTIHQNTKIFCKIVAPSRIQPVDSRWPDIEVEITVDRARR